MPEPVQKSPQAKEHRRRIYLRQRIPLVKEELQRLTEETATLSNQVKAAADPKSPEIRSVRGRLIYAGEHRDALRKELRALLDEQKALPKPEKAAPQS